MYSKAHRFFAIAGFILFTPCALAQWKLPAHFEPVATKSAKPMIFRSNASGYQVLISTKNIEIFPNDAKRASNSFALEWLNASPRSRLVGQNKLAATKNYLLGNDRKSWRKSVPIFETVKQKNIYPGIDLSIYQNNENLEYDFIIEPGADTRKIQFELRNVERAFLEENGNLKITAHGNHFIHHRPHAFQTIDGTKRTVESKIKSLGNNRYAYELGNYDTKHQLVIDPVISYSSYFGGVDNDTISATATDSSGNIYVVGTTSSSNISLNAYDGICGNTAACTSSTRDVFVAKFNSTGSLLFSTYYGGDGDDIGSAIAVDTSGNVYIAGTTNSANLPVAASFKSTLTGTTEGFVAKLNAAGTTLGYSSFFGAIGETKINAMAIDTSNSVIIAGSTTSTQTDFGDTYTYGTLGGIDAFVATITPTPLIYSKSRIAGINTDVVTSLTIDSSSNIYVTGVTYSTDFPATVGAADTTCGIAGTPCNIAISDAFVAKLPLSGSPLTYLTFLGGSDRENDLNYGRPAIAIDSTLNAYVTGTTNSADFPVTANAYDKTYCDYTSGCALANFADTFVTRINAAGNAFDYSTLIGGQGDDSPQAIVIDANGVVTIAGYTQSNANMVTSFPQVSPLSFNTSISPLAYISRFDPTLSNLLFSSYYGGNTSNRATGLALLTNELLVVGETDSNDFPTTNARQAILGGMVDGFIVKLNSTPATLSVNLADSPDPVIAGKPITYIATITNTGTVKTTNTHASFGFPGGFSLSLVTSTVGTCTTQTPVSCSIGELLPTKTATIKLIVTSSSSGLLASQLDVSATELTMPITTGVSTNIAISNFDLTVTLDANPPTVNVGESTRYTVTVINPNNVDATNVITALTPFSGMTSTAVATTQGKCSGSPIMACYLGTIAPGSVVIIDYDYRLDQPGSGDISVAVSASEMANHKLISKNTSVNSPNNPTQDKRCFIATAAYGSALSGDIQVLRDFRDRYLLTNTIGKQFVALYYQYSPPVAALIGRHETSRLFVRAMLWPVIFTIKFPAVILLVGFSILAFAVAKNRRRLRLWQT